jgi:hypothetical protein
MCIKKKLIKYSLKMGEFCAKTKIQETEKANDQTSLWFLKSIAGLKLVGVNAGGGSKRANISTLSTLQLEEVFHTTPGHTCNAARLTHLM